MEKDTNNFRMSRCWIHTWIHFNLLQVPVENLCASFHIWFGHSHLRVKTSWADQGATGWDRLVSRAPEDPEIWTLSSDHCTVNRNRHRRGKTYLSKASGKLVAPMMITPSFGLNLWNDNVHVGQCICLRALTTQNSLQHTANSQFEPWKNNSFVHRNRILITLPKLYCTVLYLHHHKRWWEEQKNIK